MQQESNKRDQNDLLDRSCSERTLEVVGWWCVSRKRQLNYVLCLYFDGLRIQHNGLRCNKTDMNVNTFNYLRRSIFRLR